MRRQITYIVHTLCTPFKCRSSSLSMAPVQGNNLCTWHDEQRQENEAAEAEVEGEHWGDVVHRMNAPYADDSEDEGWYN
jgi:hypothetical protein